MTDKNMTDIKDPATVTIPHMVESSWDEFYDSGMLWVVNHTLHIFGWSIVLQCDEGKAMDAWPSRTKYEGFTEEVEKAGYTRVKDWLKKLYGSHS